MFNSIDHKGVFTVHFPVINIMLIHSLFKLIEISFILQAYSWNRYFEGDYRCNSLFR